MKRKPDPPLNEIFTGEAQRKDQKKWLEGWRHGAAFLPIPDEYRTDIHFADGWGVGREAKAAARTLAEKMYGVKVGIITPAAPQEPTP